MVEIINTGIDLFVLFLMLLYIATVVFYVLAFITGAPFVPAPRHVVREMVDLAQIKKGTLTADFGSGDGRIVILAAQKGDLSHGWEINPSLIIWSVMSTIVHGVFKRTHIHWRSFYQADIRKTDVVFLYGITAKMPNIEKKLLKDLKKGAKVICYMFPLPSLTPYYTSKNDIYCYRI